MSETKGKSAAAKAWGAYSDFLLPVTEPVAKRVAGHVLERLIGFWTLWHLYGGLEPLIASGLLARTTVYRQRAEFMTVFKVNVEDFGPELAKDIRREGERGGIG